jgi:DNA-binding NtrC family response regulator
MKSHEGAVTVQSQPGEGTTFLLYFPADGADVTEAPLPPKTELLRGSGQRVLFIDDEKPLAMLGFSILESLGYQPTAMHDASEALACLQADPQAFDLVVTDLSMPGIMGTDLAAEVLSLRPDLPVILTTGYTASLTSENLRDMGIRELLMKPFNFTSLGAVVHRVLNTPSTSEAR